MPKLFDFEHIAIIGPGLLGGSIGLAAKELYPEITLSVWGRRVEALYAVEQSGFADRVSSSLSECVAGCDLVILTTPIEAMPSLAQEFLSSLAPHAIVTDVGSVKQSVHANLKPILGSKRWIGGHPMAGSEQGGLAAARADLFKRSVTILTPDEQTPTELVTRVSRFWEALGSKVVLLDPATHDHLIADISHLPHLIAALLVNSVNEQSIPLAGPGFRDSTRIASGPANLWREILLANRQSVIESLDKFITEAQRARTHLQEGDALALETLLADASQKRKLIS